MFTRTGEQRHSYRATIALAIMSVSVAGLAACSSDDSSGGDNHVVLQEYTGGSEYLNYLTKELGNFKKAGIDAEIKDVSNGPQAVNAILAGSVDVAALNPTLTGPVLVKGKKLEVISGYKAAYPALTGTADMAGKEWPDSLLQLKGKTVGVIALGGADQAMCQIALRAAGVKDKDINWVATGSGQGTAAAMSSGKVAGSCASDSPTASLVASGLPELFSFVNPVQPQDIYPSELQDYMGTFSYLQAWVDSSWAEKNPKAVTGVQKAFALTIDWMNEPGNFDKLVSILKKSPYYIKTLSDEQFTGYVKRSIPMYNIQFTDKDAKTWTAMEKEFRDTTMPKSSAWVSSAVVKSTDDVQKLLK
ncbi:ABC-type nitrate/sulfonate/bicarbonate transport system substrate-binding protein [Antricoccus suffuscus]|uniref:ABC-type nitrate/sulfonate/bicarbonate transport system substrate-binding protein n=1 Tax=Antricoccus suffuscus TaxID=1629062 RepID=A0A2T1A5Y1_9ACTN|nr:ABC transporter substrate-binding protein [Antricoccus suffuscus]PRZ43974.1 ABC-type nitrate/sulfonate/bicarbonate transport system substrate-binding protein [Antricoccus suffuscus]